ncbi:hypothetical protein, partial [Cellulomonas oligotrophica]
GEPAAPGAWGTPAAGPQPGVPQPAAGWQAPAGWGGAHDAPQPAYGPAGGGWVPAPVQPGIVPLRPLGLGEVLDGSVRAIRANPTVMFGLTALVVTVTVVLQTLVQLYLSRVLAASLSDAMLSSGLAADGGAEMTDILALSGAQTVTAPLLVPAVTMLTGLLIVSVSRSVIGRTVSIREVLRSPRVWWVFGFSVLVGLAQLVVLAALVGVVVLAFVQGQEALAWVVLVVGLLAVLVAGVWVMVRTLLVPAALMLEGKPFWATVARAWRLTRGSFWRLLGIYLLSSVLVSVLAQLFVVPASLIGSVVVGATGSYDLTLVVSAIGNVVGLTVSTSFLAAVVALLYVDVRMRSEGLDVELARAATTA